MNPRKSGRLGRAAVDDAQRPTAERAVARRVLSLPCLQRAQRVAIYAAISGELSLAPLADALLKRGRGVFLPVLASKPDKSLWFVEWRPDSAMAVNRFGIAEPRNDHRRFRATELDVVVAPLVAFDRQCNRIGTGGGFYDRSLAHRRRHPLFSRPKLVGVAFDQQEVEDCKPAPHDVAMDHVVTPTRRLDRHKQTRNR